MPAGRGVNVYAGKPFFFARNRLELDVFSLIVTNGKLYRIG